jgi:hypothetical protein
LASLELATGSEGRLQKTVLIFSIMAIVLTVLNVWIMLMLRLLAMLYVKKQVRSLRVSTAICCSCNACKQQTYLALLPCV